MWRSLKTRIVGFSLTIFLFSIWLLALYSSQVMHEDMQRLLGQQQLSAAASIATRIDGDIEDRLNALGGYANALDTAMLDQHPSLQIDIEKQRLLASLFNAGVMVLDPAGRLLAGTALQTELAALDYSGLDFVAAAIRDGRPGVGRSEQWPKLNVPVVGMAAPVRNPQGKILSVVAGLTRLDKPSFLDQVLVDSFGKVEDVIVVSRQYRTVVTASDKQRVGESLGGPGMDLVLDLRARGREGTEVFVNEQGVQVLSSVKAVPAANWYVDVSMSTEQAYSTIELAQRRLALAALLVTLLAVGLIWWMVRNELMPLSEAVQALAKKREPGQRQAALVIRRDDEIGELLGAFNDAVARLNQREALFRQILDTSSVAIFVVDQQGLITQANRRMAEMFACSSRELVGREYVELVDPCERDVARQKMLALLDSKLSLVESDRLYWRDDGCTFWGHLSGKRFTDEEGHDRGLIGVIADITERKLVEDRLQRHDNRMSAVIEHFPGGISMIDQDLRLVAYNLHFKQLLELPDSLFEKSDLGLEDFLRFNAQRGEYGPGDIEQQVSERVERARKFEPHKFERVRPDGTALEVQGAIVPGGGFVTIYLDITERKKMEEQVRQLAFYDPLTKLANRRLFNDRLSQSLAASKRSGAYGALMFLDLDHFKELNDTHGHAAGDLLLIEVAARLKNCVRKVDTLARLGGDEFVVVIDSLGVDKTESTAQASVIADKIGASLAQPYYLSIQQEGLAARSAEHLCSASIGVVVFIEREGSQEDFLRRADGAMYQAKQAGRNLIRFSEV